MSRKIVNKKANILRTKKQRRASIIVDAGFANAAQLVLPAHDSMELVLIGCGGTGSWLAPSLVRLARLVSDVSVTFVDPDTVNDVNIPRQNFCNAEVGRYKAETLAQRYSAAWGVEIGFHAQRFTAALLKRSFRDITILIGCVDNAAARKSIASALSNNTWWLDSGNSSDHGQVLLGSTSNKATLKKAFPQPKICNALPSPALQSPDLLTARPIITNVKLSCAELQAASAQSLAINQRMAAEVSDYLMRMIVGPGLRRFATTIDLVTGTARSRPITPEEVCR